jgi:hypothetical protein
MRPPSSATHGGRRGLPVLARWSRPCRYRWPWLHVSNRLHVGDGGRDSPDGLVGNDNFAPVLNLVGNSLKLLGNDLDGVTRLALLQSLTAAQNDTEATIYRRLCLARSEVVALLEDLAALRVADEGPGDAAVLQLVGRDLTGESTVGLVEDVLCGDFETLAEVLACKEEVEGWWCDDDLYAELAICFCGGLTEDFRSPDTFQKRQIGHTDVLVELGLVEIFDDVGDRLDRTVPLEWLAPSAVLQVLTAWVVTYILKFPPTKN